MTHQSKTGVQFLLKTPKHGRASFSIVRRTVEKSTLKTSNETLKLPQLASINSAYQSKQLNYDSCLQLAKEVVAELYEKEGRLKGKVVHNDENRELLDLYWNSEYKDKDITSPKAALNRLKRAVEAVGSLSLRSASREALQKEIDKTHFGNKQRAVVAALNQILAFIKRGDRLRKSREEVRSPRHLKQSEFESLRTTLHNCPPNVELVFQVAFATGCRLGEIFALNTDDLEGLRIGVLSQMDESGKLRETKTRQNRYTIVMPEYKKAVQQWLKVPIEERFKIRNLAWSKITRKACRAAKLSKVCVFHDLRHSFAIHLRAQGASIGDIANALGNSIMVAEKYYAGKVGTSQSLDNLLRVLS